MVYAAFVVYLALGLSFTLWADWKANQLGLPGCPSILSGIITSIMWLPIMVSAIIRSKWL